MKTVEIRWKGEIVDWHHDVVHLKQFQVNHRIMRNERFSLCGKVIRDADLSYVGAWDDGAPCTCTECNRVWTNMRRAAKQAGVMS